MGRLGWLFSSVLIGVLAAGASYVAISFGYREQFVLGTELVTIPDRWISLWIAVAATVPSILVGIMRRHDRNRSGWDATAISVLTLAVAALETSGVLSVPGLPFPISIIALVAYVYWVIVLLFLPGDKGANRYGSRDGHPEIIAPPSAPAAAAYSAAPVSHRNPLEGAPKPTVTLTEQANGQRIPRSMFIGHTLGYLLLFALVIVASFFVGLFRPPNSPMGQWELDRNFALALLAVGSVIALDLMVRRRHDRGRSGVDAVVWLMLALALAVIHIFDKAPDLVLWFDAIVGLYGLYLFVVLVLLPGNPHENRYGAVPRPD
jgi:uncharacterized membrane protein YhaH (DUF805 family)